MQIFTVMLLSFVIDRSVTIYNPFVEINYNALTFRESSNIVLQIFISIW